MQAGVDIGGTFTDFISVENGQLHIHKQLSTPDDPSRAMLAGLAHLTANRLSNITRVAHGSTVATNAILERKGARTALLMTAGFRDVLFIGRQNRPQLYALHPTVTPPVIPRDRCFEVVERLDHRGEVLLPLDMNALDNTLDQISELNVDAIGVCLLYSFINPEHEDAIKARIVDRGIVEPWQVALSCDVLPEFREYERASTVALEAYVRPVMVRYIDQLAQKLDSNTRLSVMKSDGGVMNAERVREAAVQTALSGPAAGVMGAFHLSQLAGYDHIITLDMGGTSTDVALLPGEPRFAPDTQIDGLAFRAQLLDIETIGAGGGSIARIDAGGALRVGPDSAGAMPGPIAYGQGGSHITVTDANVMLGLLEPDHFLGGNMSLDQSAVRTAFKKMAKSAGMSAHELARGVIDVANVNIDRALRRVSVARGHDPRDFTLVAFGGAGPLHACAVAERLEIPRILIPRHPGVLCAYGLLAADMRVNQSRAVLARATRTLIARLRALQAEVIRAGIDDLTAQGVPEERISYCVLLDMRYAGQAYELPVPFEGDPVEQFHRAHEQRYGHHLPQRAVEIVNMRLEATGVIDKPVMQPEPSGTIDPSAAFAGEQQTANDNHMAIYSRDRLKPGMQFNGAALVRQFDSTVFVAEQWSASVDGYHNLILERD